MASKKSTKTEVVKGYKVFNPDFTCRGMQYEVGKEYSFKGKIKICSSGLHFCLSAQDCFKYYDFNTNNVVCEVEARGKIEYYNEDSKGCTDLLFITRRLTWEEVLRVANTGIGNSGHSNSGDRNSGNWNSGDRNSGDSNSGDLNSGNWNSGDRNSGDSNSGYRNSGAFCTDTNPTLYLFDKPTNIKVKEWENHKAVHLMYKIDFTLWIPANMMTEDEKKAYPKYETTDGYLKTISKHEAWANFWHNLSEGNKAVFTTLPNFCPIKFKEITGITTN